MRRHEFLSKFNTRDLQGVVITPRTFTMLGGRYKSQIRKKTKYLRAWCYKRQSRLFSQSAWCYISQFHKNDFLQNWKNLKFSSAWHLQRCDVTDLCQDLIQET